jgi:hypothetical protein
MHVVVEGAGDERVEGGITQLKVERSCLDGLLLVST